MAYNKFKRLSQLEERFGISYQSKPFLPSLTLVKVSERLFLDLNDAVYIPLTTEKSKSEHIVVPVLKELLRNNIERISYFSGFQFDVDASQNLSGFCDFILSAKAHQLEVVAPVFCLVEAKNAEIEKGLAQCAAEMIAAKIFNERNGTPKKLIFGCVTNAFSWCFLKLEDSYLVIDPNYVPLTFTEPERVLTILEWILNTSISE